MKKSLNDGKQTGIAVVGISGRYPGGANTPARLWQNLKAGIDAVSEAKGDRWDLGHHHPDGARDERVYTRAGGYLDQIDGFDHEFFGLSPREVRQVDPQQRLLLELAWEALEDAAIPLSKISGSDTGVFIGISSNDYASLVGPGGPDAYSNTGSSFSIAANRISYFLDLHGPSVAMDTACSSSIVGVHQACTSLLAGECSVALAGGVSLLINIKPWLGFAKASMLSPTGRCKSFDASGDGYVRSEGGGIVVLKPLEAAERDGDFIYGVILASAVNSDGHTLGLSMPNVDAQERLLRKVYAKCGIPPEDVIYVEAHGTGTSVGDPIECESIGRVLGKPRQDGSNCLIGSVKSNIGHLEAASGMAGLTKALLTLKHREIPANLHFNSPNPKIDFEGWKLGVVTQNTTLTEGDKPLVVGVNSFGFGGTNAHLAIQEYRPADAAVAVETKSDWQQVLWLSGHTPAALRSVVTGYIDFLREEHDATWKNICGAAALCRSHLRHRLAVEASTPAEAVEKLEQYLRGESPLGLATGTSASEEAPVAFVYSGNGPQWWGMGRELMECNSEFRQTIQTIDDIFQPLSGWSLVEEMKRPEVESRTALTEIAQPLLFALQIALTKLLSSAGIHPAATLGHSVGEVAAAYTSGAMTLEQATLVIYNRSIQQARTAGMGTMAAIGVSSAEALEAISQIPGWLELAASNAPKAVTVAGDPKALEQLRATMTEAGKFARVLPLQYAFHTTAMDGIKDDLIESLQTLVTGPCKIPFVSTVAAGELSGEELGARYWWRNVREPVRFSDAVDHLLTQRGISLFVEIGPHPVLKDYILQCAKARDINVTAIGSLRRAAANRPEPELKNLWTAVCTCHANGAVNPQLFFDRPYPVPALPLYPWQRTAHWRGAVVLPDVHHSTHRDHPLLGYRVSAGDGLWENTLDTNLLPYLLDHVVQDSVVFPAAGYIENALAACRLLFGEGAHDVESFEILRPLTIPTHTDPLIQLAADSKDGTFEISARADKHTGDWTKHVRGRLSLAPMGLAERFDRKTAIAQLPCHVSMADHYLAAERRGLAYGPAFQGVKEIFMTEPEAVTRKALAEIHLPSLEGVALKPYLAHPALTDSCVQVMLTLIGQNELRECSIIPVFIEKVRSYSPAPNHLYCHVTILRESDRSAVADFNLFDLDGTPVISILGTRCQKVDFKRGSASSLIAEWWRPDTSWASIFAKPLQLPSPTEIVNGLSSQLDNAITTFERISFYTDILPGFNRLAGAYAANTLRALGAPGGAFNLARLMKRGRVKQDQERLLSSLVDMCEADGQLMADEKGWRWNDNHFSATSGSIWRDLASKHPRYIAELINIASAGDSLSGTLRGETPPTLEGSASVDQMFDTAPFQAIYSHLLRSTLLALIDSWPNHRPIRIIEVGGAGGGLAATLLPVLPALRTDYLFTDASETALARAEHRFNHYKFVRYAPLDISSTESIQKQPLEYFDLVVSGNALHMSNDLHSALVNVKSLLAPGGQLVAVESHEQRLTTLMAGSNSDWWRLEDSDVRTHSRLLTVAAWPDAFERAGFLETATISDTSAVTAAGPTQQTIFLCRKPVVLSIEVEPLVSEPRHWLLLGDAEQIQSGMVARAQHALLSRQQTVTVYELPASESLTSEAVKILLEKHLADSIVYLASSHSNNAQSALTLIQTIEHVRHENPPQLTFVTHGALASPFAGPLHPEHACIFGMVRVASNEHPNLGCRLVDVYAEIDSVDAGSWLAEELLRRDSETEVQLIDGMRYVNRERLSSLSELTSTQNARGDSGRPFRLDFVPQGGLDSLHLHSLQRREPQADEVEIGIHASGLNFRDVLWAMGMLPEEAVEKGFSGPTIGMECAGEVIRTGSNVTGFQAGDRVVAFASSCFGSHVTTKASSVARIPDGLHFDEAATIPITFLTAYYALDHLARLSPGETILIHGAAGGVGLAAIQIAKLKGATVIGTAGSATKRRLVETIGADHVLNSRSLEFADDVMKLTNSAGVDVVLNSLAGEAITKGLQILRPFGRFLEIGKRDLYANSRIGLRPFRQNLSYFGIDADTLLIEKPALARELFQKVMSLFVTGDLKPIPFQALPISRASEAFRTMQQSRHVGKLVLSMKADLPGALAIVGTENSIKSDGTYLVTGGLGGFGLTTAQWLVAQGARSIALIGRRGAVTDEAKQGIAVMERAGAMVRSFSADVSEMASVEAVAAAIRNEMLPLRGVIHSAAVIEDAPILNITEELLNRVLKPKMQGAWNLHQVTLNDSLDLFVLYSSSSVMVGNPGQGAYVAANFYLEALAQYRRALGLPALAVGWGAIKDAGFLTRHAAVAEMLKNRSGLDATPAAEALSELGKLTSVGASRVCIAKFNLQRLGQMLAGARIPRFLPIIPEGAASDLASADSLGAILKQTPAAGRRELVILRIKEHTGRVLGTGASQLDVDRSLSEMGLDSLMAVELAEAVERDIEQPISVMQMLSAGSISAIADLVLRTVGLSNEDGATSETVSSSGTPGATGIQSNGKSTLAHEGVVQAQS